MPKWKTHKTWIIEYWNPHTEDVDCYSCDDTKWIDAPINNVLYVYVQYKLRNNIYTHVVSGYDYYFLDEKTNHFGGWNSYIDIVNEKNFCGREYVLTPYGEEHLATFNEQPTHIDGKIVKLGVEVGPPWDEKLGFTAGKRTTPCCMERLLGFLYYDE